MRSLSLMLLCLAGGVAQVGAEVEVQAAGEASAPALELTLPRVEQNPRPEDRALALFREDAHNRALVCPRRRSATQPEDPATMRCAFSPLATLPTSPALRAGLSETSYEHDGMYGYSEDVVLVSRTPSGAERVVGTLTQRQVDVYDASSVLRMRRQRVVRARGGDILCVESVIECGPGLFTLMERGGRPYRPHARSRGVDAFRLTPAGTLERAAALDGLCPARGYQSFVPPLRDANTPIERRRRVQGEDPHVDRRHAAGCQ